MESLSALGQSPSQTQPEPHIAFFVLSNMITFNLTPEEAGTIVQALDFARKNCPIEQVRGIIDLVDKLKEQAKASTLTSND
jgi:hypothetical protein